MVTERHFFFLSFLKNGYNLRDTSFSPVFIKPRGRSSHRIAVDLILLSYVCTGFVFVTKMLAVSILHLHPSTQASRPQVSHFSFSLLHEGFRATTIP